MLKLPAMGWMSWEIFRCNVDCDRDPGNCISERLYKEMGDAMSEYLEKGYETISIDDCWMSNERTEGKLTFNASRFPSGPSNLSATLHGLGLKFGLYADEGQWTCEGYPGSQGYEAIDGETFREWGVDYLKFDGCYGQNYEVGYPAMGTALENITFSCSWAAYLGDNETEKPFDKFIDAGCDLWRNWHDIQCSWESLVSIIDHWGNYSATLMRTKGHDPDMLLAGNDCITIAEAQSQFAIWSIVAAPLIMGNDLRTVSTEAKDILLNEEAIAIDQDPSLPGGRVSAYSMNETEVWQRNLTNGDVALAVLNKANSSAVVSLELKHLDLPGSTTSSVVAVRDIFRRTDLHEPRSSSLDFQVSAHGVAFLRLSFSSDLLSEQLQ